MSTQHTPGPWRYEPGRNDRPPYVIRGSEGGFVVVGMTAARQDADARLIAAAPDLLSALVEIRAYLSKCPPHAEDITGAEWGRMMDLSGAALSRVEGKS